MAEQLVDASRIVGRWGPKLKDPVHQFEIQSGNNVRLKALKVKKKEEAEYLKIEMFKHSFFHNRSPNRILDVESHSLAETEEGESLCVVLPFVDIFSIRSLIKKRYANGMPLSMIRTCLIRSLGVLGDLHDFGELHNNLNVGNLYFDRRTQLLLLGYGATAYERDQSTYGDPSNERDVGKFLPIEKMHKWGRGRKKNQEVTLKDDIWYLGLMTLEMGYGKIEVNRRSELLDIVDQISRCPKLPNQWDDLRIESLFKRVDVSESRFPSSFRSFLLSCLNRVASDRSSVQELRAHEFLGGFSSSVDAIGRAWLGATESGG